MIWGSYYPPEGGFTSDGTISCTQIAGTLISNLGVVMTQQAYSCAKCGGIQYTTGEIRTTGSGLSRFLNIQNQKYATISCQACGYTELYRRDGSGFGNVLDFFTN